MDGLINGKGTIFQSNFKSNPAKSILGKLGPAKKYNENISN